MMDTSIILALIGILGTTLVAFITMFFNYLSKKLEHKLFVKQIRATRTFDAYEQLIPIIQNALAVGTSTLNNKPVLYLHILSSAKNFREWYEPFLVIWFTKQYLLDKTSYENCHTLHNTITMAIYKYPNLLSQSGSSYLTLQEIVELSATINPLALKTGESLTKHLLHTIEDI